MNDSSAPNRTRPLRPALQGAPEPIAALNRVKILEYAHPWQEREPLVDVRDYCPDVSWNSGICPYLRQSVADRVRQAQSSLPTGYRLKAGTALRTLAMQQGGWDGYFRRMQEEHPNWPLSALRRAVNKYFAPYDQKAPPGHCTGGAIDVGLLDSHGNSLDMTSPTKGWEGAYTWSERISPEARANRMIMVEVMLAAGFSNCRDEYWHYSRGDSAWAVRVGEHECPYGWVYPPAVLEKDFEGASAIDLNMETVRDWNGRPISAQGSCALPDDSAQTPGGQPDWSVGLYWARGIPVTLLLRWPVSSEIPSLFIGNGKYVWQPLDNIVREGENLVLRFVPSYDRSRLSSYATPEPPEAEEKKS